MAHALRRVQPVPQPRKVESLPKVTPSSAPRAELPTPSPEAYAKQTNAPPPKAAPAPEPVSAERPDSRDRIDAILNRLGVGE